MLTLNYESVHKAGVFQWFSAQIEMVPRSYRTLDNPEHVTLMKKLIDITEDDDDVQNLWCNRKE